MTTVIEKILEHRQQHKATLSGIELMQWNLYWKLRSWIMRETEYRCVCISEIVDKVEKYAPKAIKTNRKQLETAVNGLWNAAHDYSINSEDWLREDLEFQLDHIFNTQLA